MENLDFKGTEILTYARMQRTLGQLENQKPEYVFIEKKLYTGQLTKATYEHFQTLTILIRYLAAGISRMIKANIYWP